ncbi:MAG TPA: arginine--tRNA ligase [Solirubrobacteraceae bacterium]|nr:arginine--tRNA ligase [Solirubrobacteraceae bacterium]
MSDPITSDQQAHDGLPDESAEISPGALRAAVIDAAAGLIGAAGDGAQGPPGEAFSAGSRGGITLERPPRPDFGDYSTNAALLLAPRLRRSPREVAEQLGDRLVEGLGGSLERFEVAGPGFVNLFVADGWLRRGLGGVLEAGEDYGADRGSPERIMVEFVSANPTGPMHVGHARNAAYGDALARMLELHGARVEREFYVNDAGSQVRTFGESIQALARGEEVPEDGYQGDYVAELAARIENAAERDAADVGRVAVALMIEQIKTSLAAFGVGGFDYWAYESRLHEGEPSLVDHALARLHELGHTYTSDGALWLRSTSFGDDKDRVLVRSNGEFTYLASDVAYHEDKRERGFDRLIDVWGADHHGYVLRLKAAFAALGGNPDDLELLIMQLVHLVRSGERAQMSKRAGEFVTLDELVAEIGVDAARWYLLARSHDTTVDLDLDLARSQSNENPVYYVQYAHARISSMLDKAGAERVDAAVASVAAGTTADGGPAGSSAPLHASERALIKQLLDFPGELAAAAERRAPHRIASYALELAQGFTAFYRDCRVLGAEPAEVESERLALCVASRDTIARCLDLLGVGAPQEM